jgi:hypothetical protein
VFAFTAQQFFLNFHELIVFDEFLDKLGGVLEFGECLLASIFLNQSFKDKKSSP